MSNNEQIAMWELLCELDGETVARLFTDFYGTQLLSSKFKEFLEDEGYTV